MHLTLLLLSLLLSVIVAQSLSFLALIPMKIQFCLMFPDLRLSDISYYLFKLYIWKDTLKICIVNTYIKDFMISVCHVLLVMFTLITWLR